MMSVGIRTRGEIAVGAAGAGMVLVLVLSLHLVALLFNDLRPLGGPDEGRYVAGALEMLRRHDLVGIFLNDDTPHFIKPR